MRSDDPGPYSLDALAAIGAPTIFTRDPQVLRARYVAFFEAATGRVLYDGQVEMLVIETLAYAMSLLGEEAQATAVQHLVAFAVGEGLDRLGPNRSTPRLAATAARVVLRVTRSALDAAAPIILSAGTRVRGDGVATAFLTLADVVIPPGPGTVDVIAEAVTAGAAPNAIPAGALRTLTTPIAGLSVTNPASPEGGADRESDAAYRLRLANAFERISKAGPRAGYREAAMAVSAAIVDVAVVRPEPCHIEVYVLTADGPAGEALRAAVAAALDPEDVRPLGDAVAVLAPAAVAVAPVITVRVTGGADVIEPQALAAAAAVLTGWRQRLGAIVAPSAVSDAVYAIPGVVDVAIAGLAYTRLSPSQYLTGAPTIVMDLIDG